MILGGQGSARRGGPWPFGVWQEYTYFLAFELHLDGAAADGVAVGQVPGHLMGQWAMDEHGGYLRAATTSDQQLECKDAKTETFESGGTRSWCGEWRAVANSTSQVTILKFPQPGENNGGPVMEHVGLVPDLGETERITAVRFFEDYAFVVTFRKTDPFYSIDLSKPEDPQLKDELKVTGYSRYLHPVEYGEDRMILAVGQEADDEGQDLGLQVSLFNVTDLSNIMMVQRSVELWQYPS